MHHRLFASAAAMVLVACAPKADLDKANAEVARLHAEVQQLQRLNDDQRQKLAAVEKQAARKPQLPVTVKLRPAILGSGYVAVFATAIKQDFPVLLTVKSTALGTSKTVRVNLTHATPVSLSRSEGFDIEPDDELVIENGNYETAHLKFNALR